MNRTRRRSAARRPARSASSNRKREGLMSRLRGLLPQRTPQTRVDDVVAAPLTIDPLPARPRRNRPQTSRNVRRVRPVAILLAWLLPMAAAIAAFMSPFLGARAYNYLMQSGHFFVREVLVSGNSRLGADEIKDLAGIRPGTHVLAANLDTMAEALQQHPWVAQAKVARELPDRLLVTVDEYRPVAYLALGDLWLVDVSGEPFALVGPRDREELPIITGILEESFEEEASAAQARADLRAAVNLARLYGSMGLAGRWPIGEVRVEAGRRMTLVLSETGTEAVLGQGPYRQKLYRLEWVLEKLHQEGKVGEYVLLDSWAPSLVGDDDGRVVVAADLAKSQSELREIASQRAELAAQKMEGLLPGGGAEGDVGPPAAAGGDEGVEDDGGPAGGPAKVSAGVRPAVEPEWLDDAERDDAQRQGMNSGEAAP